MAGSNKLGTPPQSPVVVTAVPVKLNHSLTMPSPSRSSTQTPAASAISSPDAALHKANTASPQDIHNLKLLHQIEVARLESIITDLKEKLAMEMNRADTLQSQLIRVLEMQAEMQEELQNRQLKSPKE